MKFSILLKMFFGLLILGGSGVLVIAQSNLNTKISAKTNVTYLELIRKVFPNARKDEKLNYLAHAVRKANSPDLLGSEDPVKKNAEKELIIQIEESLETRYDNEKPLWLILRAKSEKDERCGNCGELFLTAFRVRENEAELIDTANLTSSMASFGVDFLTISNKTKLEIAPRREAVIINNHEQISMGTDSFMIVDIDKSRFRVVFKEFYLEHDDRCDSFYDDTARVILQKKSIAGYRNIEVIVTQEKGEGDITYWRKRYRYVYAWNPRRQSYQLLIKPKKKRPSILLPGRGCGDG